MRKNPHVRICGGLGSATTLVYPTARGGDRRRGRSAHRPERVGNFETSSSYMLAAVANISDEQMHEAIQIFGQETTVQASLFTVVRDMHEHLGQAIAYARMNGVVPPWTARQQRGE